MKILLVLGTVLALASCGRKADTTADARPGAATTAMGETPSPMANQAPTGSMAGTYEVTMADGTLVAETIDPDGTYTDVAKGTESRGKWRMQGDKSCFDPDGAAAEVCYTSTAPKPDGSFTVIGPDGKSISTVRKVGAAPAR